jgi:uncharacterized protein (DUF302 family)
MTKCNAAISAIGLAFGLFFSTLALADGAGMPRMLIEVPSPYGFEETLEKLEDRARGLGWKVPSKWKVNFQANLERVTGIDVGPNQVIKMCAPTPAAQLLVKDEYKMLSAMMPCTLAVYVKSDGKTYISMMNLELMGQMYGGDVAEMAKELAPQMEAMVDLD